MSDHPIKTQAQARKAARMAAWLRKTAERRGKPELADPGATARLLDSDTWWWELARLTPGVNADKPPSHETRAMCIGFLEVPASGVMERVG